MGLTLRPTGVESPVDKNRQDFTIFSGKWEMGRIYKERSGPVNARDRRQATGHGHRRSCADA
jgi:hypothetical protein